MKYKILIIEDDNFLANNLVSLLEEEGYEVESALNGLEGIAKAKLILPDLIICDIMMPIKDGYEVKNKLNTSENTFDIPFVFLTAKTDYSELREGMNLGADDYLFKPYKASELLAIIQKKINKNKRTKEKIVANILSENSENPKSIKVKIGNELRVIKINSIAAFFASNQYSNMLTEEGKQIILRKSLNDWEDFLPSSIFVRVHRGTIINKNFIQEIKRTEKGSYMVLLNNYSEWLPISRSNFTRFKNTI
jgi:DNA-binding LytR/AlgR family response regulator